VMNRAYLTNTPAGFETAFAPYGGFAAVQAELNGLTAPARPEDEFIARWYAPRNTETADWRTERLFYTRENALWLDAVRQRIDGLCPGDGPARDLLLALLVYEASVHSNTSGVFKAFHKGFGGHAADALGRIKAPMALETPELWESPRTATASALDAAAFLSGRSADLVYLDPPYNQHQYGSNYHLLNTVVLGDRFVPELKAGIRRDWIKTRSPFCSKATAFDAFSRLVDAADARHLVVSYNTEGLVPFDQLYDLLDRRGRVTLVVQDYVTYRGGRQSPGRRTHNLEFCLVVDTAARPGTGQRGSVDRFLAEKRVGTLLKGAFVPERLRAAFPGTGGTLTLGNFHAATEDLHRIAGGTDLTALDAEALAEVAERLARAACASHQEEFAVLLELWKTSSGPLRTRRTRRMVLVLKKFAFRQYRSDFEAALTAARKVGAADPLVTRLLDELEPVALRRFAPR
jgi:adenine-specific DNA-methyltransferase